MTNIVYLDTDFMIKTFAVQNVSSTLFDEILKLPYEFRLTKRVYSEVKDKKLIEFIKCQILNKKIKIVGNLDIAIELRNYFDEKTIEHIILSELNDITKTLFEDDGEYYKDTYYSLEALMKLNSNLDDFLNELNIIFDSIGVRQNIGETVTILNMSLANRLDNVEIISLFSHDASARRCVLKMSENVKSYDCYSCFYLLKDILPFEYAKNYVKLWCKVHKQNTSVKIMINNRSKGCEFMDFINKIYNTQNYHILKNGVLSIL